MSDFLALPLAERRLAFGEAAQRLQVAPVMLEKDFWVCWLLERLFSDGLPVDAAMRGMQEKCLHYTRDQLAPSLEQAIRSRLGKPPAGARWPEFEKDPQRTCRVASCGNPPNPCGADRC